MLCVAQTSARALDKINENSFRTMFTSRCLDYLADYYSFETVKQALDYRKALARRPDWNHEIATTVVEVCGSAGYNWFDL